MAKALNAKEKIYVKDTISKMLDDLSQGARRASITSNLQDQDIEITGYWVGENVIRFDTKIG